MGSSSVLETTSVKNLHVIKDLAFGEYCVWDELVRDRELFVFKFVFFGDSAAT